MTTPAPPALEPCPHCGKPPRSSLLSGDAIWCPDCRQDRDGTYSAATWNRRSPVPSPPAEVARLSELLIEWIDRAEDAGRHSDAALFGDVQKCLISQASALADTERRRVEAEGYVKRLGDGYDMSERALLALGCRLGDKGWEKPCDHTGMHTGKHFRECSGFLPITAPPPAPSGEEGEK